MLPWRRCDVGRQWSARYRSNSNSGTLSTSTIDNGASQIVTPAAEKGLQAGFFRYLTKPIKTHEFMDTLEAALKFAEQETVHN